MLITDLPDQWRSHLRRASFRGVEFHVERGGVVSGRRVAVHEFPKRNIPFAEDMGRRARIWPIQGYLIVSPLQSDYIPQRNDLLDALEADGPGTLIHPTLGEQEVMVQTYSYDESREKGGYCTFDMVFIERGQPVVADVEVNTSAQVDQAADQAAIAAQLSMDNAMAGASQLAQAAVAAFNELGQ